ncbi:hypothetical protein [Frigidibacter mobilis]|uniref:Glycosyl transferase family 2 n=1 Tax=Frigidibacter mobilis TaxID=1335048 RepID=A0A159YZW3_9RHOB|nr:hypothetical protein [Frigidibacter mobilis]AMY68136.1 hypothetical protein AKL17_0877 [Frigidibacter mobilis]
MDYTSIDDFLARGRGALAKGPVALILAEDLVEVDSTLRHHLKAGFRAVLLFAPPELDLPADLSAQIHRITYQVKAEGALVQAVNPIIAASPPTTWIYYGYNAEYLFHPFCETRSVRELIAFHAEERRDAMLCYVVDLYAGDLWAHPDAVDLDSALMDRTGYYALARKDEAGHIHERQLDFFGGIRWRFEEHIPKDRRRIDRIALFRAQPGLRLRRDHTFTVQEYNTFACPWHNNMTATVMSFRTAKALKTNPGSTYDIDSFRWHNSVPFQWHSQQLMELGLMEPGQWF